MSLDPLIYNGLSIGFISRGYVLGLYLAEKGTRLSGTFDYPEAAKSHDSRIIGTCLYSVLSLLQKTEEQKFFLENLLLARFFCWRDISRDLFLEKGLKFLFM